MPSRPSPTFASAIRQAHMLRRVLPFRPRLRRRLFQAKVESRKRILVRNLNQASAEVWATNFRHLKELEEFRLRDWLEEWYKQGADSPIPLRDNHNPAT
jgi:hypothetical protein